MGRRGVCPVGRCSDGYLGPLARQILEPILLGFVQQRRPKRRRPAEPSKASQVILFISRWLLRMILHSGESENGCLRQVFSNPPMKSFPSITTLLDLLLWVLWAFSGFYWVPPGLTRFYWVLLGLSRFRSSLVGFIGLYWVLRGFSGCKWVLWA